MASDRKGATESLRAWGLPFHAQHSAFEDQDVVFVPEMRLKATAKCIATGPGKPDEGVRRGSGDPPSVGVGGGCRYRDAIEWQQRCNRTACLYFSRTDQNTQLLRGPLASRTSSVVY